MTDTKNALAAARNIVGLGHEESRFRRLALQMVDDLERRLDGCAGEEIESVIGAFYEESTGVPPYGHPGNSYAVRKARVVFICRDLVSGRAPKAKYMFGKDALRSAAFSGTLSAYGDWMACLGKSEATIDTRLQRVDVMLRHLESRGICSLAAFGATDLAEFIASLDGRFTAVGKSNILYTLRNFFSCPTVASELAFDPYGLLTNLHTPKHTRTPSVYSADEVSAALANLDRGTDAGRTHYLVFVLAAVYGLRSSDIKNLKVGDIDFAHGTITIVQHKTGSSLTLPLPECVKLPLLDYMLNTRCECDCDNVLVKFRGKPGPYSPKNHFGGPLAAAMDGAGVIRAGRHAGLHSLRHTLATRLTSDGVPIDEVASVLGHTSAASTKAYVWSDVEHLRLAALEVD